MELPAWYSEDKGGQEFPFDTKEREVSVAKWCNAVFEEAKDELERYEEIIQLEKNINYLMGKQWTKRRPTYKASPVSNRIWSNLIQLVSYLTDMRQAFDVKAGNRNYDETAEIINKMAKAWFHSEDVDMTLAMTIIHASLTIGYTRQVWNKDLDGGQGQIELTPLGALDLIPIRPGHNLQQSLGVIYRAAKPLSWFREKFPLKGWAVPIDDDYSHFVATMNKGTPSMTGLEMQLLSPQYRRLFNKGRTESKQSVIPMALLKEFWIRDPQRNQTNKEVFVGRISDQYGYVVKPGGKLYPRGRLIVMGGPRILYDGPNPFFHGQFPFSALRLNRVPWQWPGVSEFRNQIPLQDIMNNVLAGILDAVKRAVNPPLLSPDNAFGAKVKRSLDPNMPNAKIFYSPASIAPPQYAQSPSLPGFVFQTMLYAQGELDSQSGFIDLQSTARRTVIPAADTLEQLKEGQQTMVRLKVRYVESLVKDVGQQFVSNALQYYNLKRRIYTLGSDGVSFEDFDYDPGTLIPSAETEKENFCKLFTFLVTPGSMLKSSRVPHQLVMNNLRRQGDLDLQSLFEALDMGNMYEKVVHRLRQEGKEIFIKLLKAQKSSEGGAGGVSPQVLTQLGAVPGEGPGATGPPQ